ncbi:MAG: type VI secretion system protein TssA [Telluria sp.]
MLDIEQLLAPISEDQPCGEDISFSPELDAIANARRADDPTLEQGAWVTTLKEADWKFVGKRCAQLIQERSKDLQLAVWLAEASAKTDGLRGLGDALLLIGALCERYWDHVHPLPDEGGFEQRIGNLHWIASRAPQMIFDVPITEGGAFSMKGADAARVRGGDELEELEAARRRSSRTFYEVLVRDLDHCAAALADLERVVDDRVGQDGPSFSAAKAALQSVIHFVTPSARESGAVATAGPDAPVDVADAPAPRAMSSGPIQNRAQALAQLRIVADFFRRTEPHSPVAYLAEKAASWGEQPLHLWLRGVVKDDATLARLEELLGVENK